MSQQISQPLHPNKVASDETRNVSIFSESSGATGVGSKDDTPADAKSHQEAGETAALNAATRKQPQRKQSVFSFNGFPDASLLLEQRQPPKARHTPADQDAASTAASKLQLAPNECSQGPGTGATGVQSVRVPQVRAMDNLGSTGSSRASSCDEPSLANGIESQQKPSNSTDTTLEKPLESPLHIVAGQRDPPCSSGSSLDTVSWCFERLDESAKVPVAHVENTLVEQQEHEFTNKTSHQQDFTPIQDNADQQQHKQPPPFESIASQLKQLNAAPDPQLIQRHIDNLISHNEAIMDNCNLISIRSYNSSQQHAARRMSVVAADKNSSDTVARIASVGCGTLKPTQQARSSKRWSTSGVPGSRAGLCSIDSDNKQPIDFVHNYAHETTNRSQHFDNDILKHLTERKRSYNALMSPVIPIAPLNPLGLNLLPDIHGSVSSFHDSCHLAQKLTTPSGTKSPLPAALDSTLELVLGLNGTKQGLDQQRPQPLQLEDAIQNLSLKRKEDVLQHQQQQASKLQFDQLQSVENCDKILECNINNNNKTLLLHNNHHHHHQQHQHHHRSYSIAGQNLISATSAHHKGSQDQQIMAAMLLNERFRESIMEQQMSLENQALFHQQQQQMIEQQLEQFRFAASLEQHQLQLASNNKATCSAKEEQAHLGLLLQACNETDLSILKRQLLLVPHTTIGLANAGLSTTDNGLANLECSRPRESLPFKKRKISEPDLRH